MTAAAHYLKRITGSFLALNCCFLLYAQQPDRSKPVSSLLDQPLKEQAQSILQNLKQARKTIADSIRPVKTALQQVKQEKDRLFPNEPLVQVHGFEASASYASSPDPMPAPLLPGTGLFYTARGTVMLANIPFQVNLGTGYGMSTDYRFVLTDLHALKFDPDEYRRRIKELILQKISPDRIAAALTDKINTIRQEYVRKLKSEIRSLQQDFLDRYGLPVNVPDRLTDLSTSDLATIRNQLISEADRDQYGTEMARYQQLLQVRGTEDLARDTAAKSMLGRIQKLNVLENIYIKIYSATKSFEDNRLVKELRTHLPFTPGHFASYLNDPGRLADVARAQAHLGDLSSFFLNIQTLNIGKSGVDKGALSLRNIVNNGLDMAFKGSKAGFDIIYGTSASANTWLQSGLTSLGSDAYTRLTGLSLSRGTQGLLNQTVSLNLFDFGSPLASGRSARGLSYINVAARKDAVASFHTSLPMKGAHHLSVDVSKSFGLYEQALATDSSFSRKSPTGELFGSSGKANYAVQIEYDGSFAGNEIGLSLKKVGLGYNNPGDPFLRRGESQVVFGVRRQLLKKKLSMKYDASYRYQAFDLSGSYYYRSLMNRVQLAYRIDRSSRIGFSYYGGGFHTTVTGLKTTSGFNGRWQLDGTYRFRLSGKWVSSSDNVSRQSMTLPDANGGSHVNRTLLFAHHSALALGKNFVVLSLVANWSGSTSYYFNTSFLNGEASYSYPVGGKLRLSSGAGYFANKGWNRQIGVRQQLSFAGSGRFYLSALADYKRSIRILRPELANQLYLNASVHYQF